MIIHEIIWLEHIEDKIIRKHAVQPYEVEEMVLNQPHIRFVERGHHPGDDVYAAFGQTESGRYLMAVFIFKRPHSALLVTCRDMTNREKRTYGKRK